MFNVEMLKVWTTRQVMRAEAKRGQIHPPNTTPPPSSHACSPQPTITVGELCNNNNAMADTDADAAKDTDADNDTTLPLLDDTPSATPLDLLLNAISGTDQYSLLADQPASSAAGEAGERFRETGEKRKRALEDSPRQTKIAKTLSSHFTDASVLAQNGRTFSTVEVWHPKTGQKSYPKERRWVGASVPVDSYAC